jgi:citrate synthase
MPDIQTKNIGLRGIPVADTKVCYIDGQNGILSYRGYRIETLAQHSAFEEVAYLLLHGDLPPAPELERFKAELAAQRPLRPEILACLKGRPHNANPMDVLQSVVPMLADYDPSPRDESRAANLRRAATLIAVCATIVAAWERVRTDQELVAPDPALSHAANFLYMLKGRRVDDEMAHYFDVCLILHAEHHFNASTFAGRSVASTRATMYASVAAALGALSGELHGGANAKAMENLEEIGELARVPDWVNGKLDRREVIMGMGHAVYKTEDPRAKVLKPMAEELAHRGGAAKWFEMSREIARIAGERLRRQGKQVWPNVDFYSGTVYRMMGIPTDLFTPVFAIGRMPGWTAHIIEEKFADAQPRPELYRPEADYIGRDCGLEGCPYVPISERKAAVPT